MDSYTDKEFAPIFDRVSREINFEGTGTPVEIHQRICDRIKHYRKLEKEGGRKLPYLKKKISQLRRLVRAGFGRRVISGAESNPRGIIALTLKYGKTRAKEILLARARARHGVSYRIRRGRFR